MITFYPNEVLGLWCNIFNFDESILLLIKEKKHYKEFRNREELIDFIKGYGFRLDEPKNPLTMTETGGFIRGLPVQCIEVSEQTLGWIIDDFK
jgi:hypothetical protein